MFEFLQRLFSSNEFMPHGHCYLWQGDVLWTHVIGDVLTATAYFLIPLSLWIFVQRRKDLKFKRIFVLFGAFILACGLTHVVDIWTIWVPTYRLESIVKLATGVISILTAFALYRLIPIALKIPSQAVFQEVRNQADQAAEAIAQIEDYAIILLNTEGYIQNWTKGALNIKGYEAEEAVGQHVSLFYLEKDRIAGLPESLLQAAKETGHVIGEYWCIRKSGTTFRASISITAIRDAEGNLTGYTKVARDLTQQIRAEEQERHLLKLEARNREVEQFAYVASHDLQEPLRTIISFVGLIQKRFKARLSQEANEHLEYVSQAALRMNRLIKDLLDYSRIGRNKEFKQVDSEEMVQYILKDLAIRIEETEAQIHIGPLPPLMAYETELRALFQNLIINALKFHRPGVPPKIEIVAHAKQGDWKFSVKDNGIGIPIAYQEKIVSIFQRLHSREEYEGTGIGLTHCRKIVELHGGQIWVESNQELGSTFYFTIPQAP